MSTHEFSSSLLKLIFFSLIFHTRSLFSQTTQYIPSDNIALNCGSSSSSGSPPYDGRKWIGDVGSNFISFVRRGTNSTTSNISPDDPSVPQIPYMTARIFYSEFTYKFNVTPGWKFLRLHFYPAPYIGLDPSKALLTVTALSEHHTLLRNFSALLNAENLEVAFLMKEFIVYAQGTVLDVSLSPSSNDSGAYAFVNGIEVVSMPENLYVGEKDAPRTFIVGQNSVLFYLDKTFSLEMCYRLNVGGTVIPPKRDTGMFRSWTSDEANRFGTLSALPFDLDAKLSYLPSVPPYTAPEMVYRTARSMPMTWYGAVLNLNYNLTWFFTVDSGFWYLVRLHFCEVDREISTVNQRVFDIFINNETAEVGFDVIAWTGGYAVPSYQDYVVMIPKVKGGEKQDLWLDLHPDTAAKPQYYDAILNGAEIFKISDYKKNLAGINPPKKETLPNLPQDQVSSKSSKIIVLVITSSVLGGLLLICIFYVSIFILGRKLNHFKCAVTSNIQVPPSSQIFSIDEIRAATDDFDESRVIGTGGFGTVYKGCINNGATMVAIKRGNRLADQGLHEFETEITLLSKLRHHNLVSLIGHCLAGDDLILVYEYMANGTLYDSIHTPKFPLTWDQRLNICIGAARGLHYLHTGSEYKIIHRDIKSSNILLDENWVAKISDFGISKFMPSISSSSHIVTQVKGTSGYLDPNYYQTLKLSEKSDVYSFGVVLLEALCATRAMKATGNGEQTSLAEWALSNYRRGTMEQVVDINLKGTIALESFLHYVEVARHCLAERSEERPHMAEVLWRLEMCLKLQRQGPEANVGGSVMDGAMAISPLDMSDATPGVEFSELMMPIGR